MVRGTRGVQQKDRKGDMNFTLMLHLNEARNKFVMTNIAR